MPTASDSNAEPARELNQLGDLLVLWTERCLEEQRKSQRLLTKASHLATFLEEAARESLGSDGVYLTCNANEHLGRCLGRAERLAIIARDEQALCTGCLHLTPGPSSQVHVRFLGR